MVFLFQHWTPPPTPSSITVASTLVLKPVCSSSGCKSFQALVVPLFLHLCFPSSRALSCSFYDILHPAVALRNEKREGVWTRANTGSVKSIFVCHLTCSFLHCWFLQLLLCGNGAPTGCYCRLPEQTFSPLPLKCPFCMSSWKNSSVLLSTHII